MSGEQECTAPSLNITEEPPAVGRFFTFSADLMKAVVGNFDKKGKAEVMKSIKSSVSSSSFIQSHIWTNGVFLFLFLSTILIAVLIMAMFISRVVCKWTKYRRRMKRKSRTLFGSVLVLVLGLTVSCFCIAIFAKWLFNFQTSDEMRDAISSYSAVEMDLNEYMKAVLCSTSQAKNTTLYAYKEQYKPVYSSLQNYTQLVQAFHVSKQMLRDVVTFTENCNQSQLDPLREYVKMLHETRHEMFVPIASTTLKGLDAFERWLVAMLFSYESRLKSRLSEIVASLTFVEITITDFVTMNEFSFKWQNLVRFVPALAIILTLICITTLICVLVYSISTFCEDPANSNSYTVQTKAYRKGAKLLNCCGFAAMLTSAFIFVATGLLLYIGYSSVLICNSFENHDYEEYDHISSDDPEVNSTALELREMLMKCRRLLPFYEAMQLKHILDEKLQKYKDRPPSSNELNRNLDSALTEDLSSIIGKHSDRLMEAMKLSKLGADACIGDKSQYHHLDPVTYLIEGYITNIAAFNDTISQIEEYARVVDEAHTEMFANTTKKYLEKLEDSVRSYKDVSESSFIASFDDALLHHSPDCSELASAVEVWKPFCNSVPLYFQGTWVICGITAIVSIHVTSAVFKASDFLNPTEHFRPYRPKNLIWNSLTSLENRMFELALNGRGPMSMRLSAEGSRKMYKRSAEGARKTKRKSAEGSAKKRNKSGEGTRKKGTKRQGGKGDQSKSVLRNVLRKNNEAEPRTPVDLYDAVPQNAHSACDDAAEMYKEDRVASGKNKSKSAE